MAEVASSRKTKEIAKLSTSPTTKRRKQEPPTAFWDNLSRLWLTPQALREFDRRTREHTGQQQLPCGIEATCVPSLKRFARHGGPDLSFIRGHPMPKSRTLQSASLGRSRKRTRDDSGASTLESKTSKSRRTTAYDPNFEQNLRDHGILMESRPQKPLNTKDLNQELGRQRRSLSPSRFPDTGFETFQERNNEVHTEADVMRNVFPLIVGDCDIPSSGNMEFNNLAPLTDGTIATDKPDYYEGSRPEDIEKHIRGELSEYIIPSTDTTRPCLPNFFTEVKGPDGSGKVLKRQACYAGAIGARAMHELRLYVNKATALDSNAYTMTWAFDSSTGTLNVYTTHPVASEVPDRHVDYQMTQLQGWALTGNIDSFRQGVSYFRNARDWARARRRELIDAANDKHVAELQVYIPTEEHFTEEQTSDEISQGSETSRGELASPSFKSRLND
ncbi:MAG: hypothetical protein Q9162_002758 [Coniocarpon cinnabarinum]